MTDSFRSLFKSPNGTLNPYQTSSEVEIQHQHQFNTNVSSIPTRVQYQREFNTNVRSYTVLISRLQYDTHGYIEQKTSIDITSCRP